MQAAERLVAVARQVPTVVIAGNHDRRGLLRYIPHRLDGLHVVDQPGVVSLSLPGGPLRVAALPFVRSPEAWADRAARLCDQGVDLLAAHQGFDGSWVPGFTFRVGRPRDTLGVQHLPPGLRWILSGHLHPRQAFPLGEATVVHAGSTERTAFSEAEQTKGTVVWEWGRSVRWRFVDGPSRPMQVVRSPGDLPAVVPGAWVAVPRDDDGSLGRAVLDRGAFLRPSGASRPPRTQLPDHGLFAPQERSASTASAAS